MVLKQSALDNNVAVMARYAAEHHFDLAPHAKTTMAPDILRRQLEAGAWGITVANVQQARTAYDAGADRVVIANEVVGRADAAAMTDLVAAGDRAIYCLVDSVAGVELLEANLRAAGARRAVGALVELGTPHGRAGARTVGEAVQVAKAVSACRHLSLAGAEGYEGGLGSDRSYTTLAAVDAYLGTLRELTLTLANAGAFASTEPIVSAGGSKYFDRVAAVLGPGAGFKGLDVRLVVRSGCYVVHDHGLYEEASPLSASRATPGLVAALEAWAEVLSVPEPGLAIVGLGKRDVSFDFGLPTPLRIARARHDAAGELGHWAVTKLDDQHGYLKPRDDGAPLLAVGDRVEIGRAHV